MQVRQRQNGYCHPVTFDYKQELQYFFGNQFVYYNIITSRGIFSIVIFEN